MLRHYVEVKAQHPEAILLYRMGDFYETFFEDAEIAAPIFEIQLTARQKGTASEAPMCGVPHHAIEGYIGKLLRAGRKVAICDQVEDPATAKGLVRREVTRVISPGTVSSLDLLDQKAENPLVALVVGEGAIGVASLEVSTGAFEVRQLARVDEVVDQLIALAPRELVLVEEDRPPAALADWIAAEPICVTRVAAASVERGREASRVLTRQLGVDSLRGFGVEHEEGPAIEAAAVALRYARGNLMADLDHVRTLQVGQPEQWVVLDEATQRNLELLRSLREGGRRHTLLATIDRTATAAGGRLLRSWLQRPSRRSAVIEARLDAVEELLPESRRSSLSGSLRRVSDLERLTARAVFGSLQPREAAALRDSLDATPEVLGALRGCSAQRLREIARVDPLADLADLLARGLSGEPSVSVKGGRVIAEGFDQELDRVRSLAGDAKGHLLAIEERERAATGIGSLKIRFNKVFGYYIEVTRSNQHLVPEHYRRKQTLANAERYVTEELDALEARILAAEEEQQELEERLFAGLCRAIADQARRLKDLASALAELDVLWCFAEVAVRHDYSRPRIGAAGGELRLVESRHPVVERTVASPFVPNDVALGAEERVAVLTGPNMGGKSTYLRQVALNVLLAHCGSFVPSARAEVPLVDRIFTRVGASDNLARGESTFMVEMIETAYILRYATSDSLVLLDEVGRGTATYDGLSLAWAIVEHLHEKTGAKTLFATHYHELTQLAETLPGVVNLRMRVKEWKESIVFLHRVEPGSADRSYGLQVARLAGVPEEVVERAGRVLHNLESTDHDRRGRPRIADGLASPEASGADQLTLFARPEDVVADLLRELDLERLTPLAALNLLATLRGRLLGADEPREAGAESAPPEAGSDDVRVPPSD